MLKTFRSDIVSKDLRPKNFKLVNAHEDFFKEFNSTQSSLHVDESVIDPQITVDEDKIKKYIGEEEKELHLEGSDDP